MKRPFSTMLVAALLLLSEGAPAQTLKLLTLNAWTGLEYSGFFAFGERETEGQRERRYRLLVDELRRLNPDVIALQEVNPVYEKAEALASELGYASLYLRTNAGVKFGALGIPWNLNEGLVVLARRDWELQLVGTEDFSSGFGITGNTFAFHFSGRPVGLSVRLWKEGLEVIVVNLHLNATLPDRQELRTMVPAAVGDGALDERTELLRRLEEGDRGRREEAGRMLEYVRKLAARTPTILMGDFNAPPDSPELVALRREANFLDVADSLPAEESLTWDPRRNPSAALSGELWNARTSDADPYDLLSSWYDTQPRRIDYILLSEQFGRSRVRSASRCFDREVLGTVVSDHYGVLAEIDLSGLPKADRMSPADGPAGLDLLPIASYDTDVGFGVGFKMFALNSFGASESIDLMAFASTGGERLLKMAFSIPDFELRQGTAYPLSFDLVAEYDKFLKNPFYGIGNDAAVEGRETYSKEPLELSALVGRGFSPAFVVQAGLKVKIVRNFNLAPGGLLAQTAPALNQGTSSLLSVVATARYDSRSSFIHPNRGELAQFDVGYGREGALGDYDLLSTSLSLQAYRPVISERTIVALRLAGQVVAGDSLPVHALAFLGGAKTLRGYPLDRFLDKVRILSTIELRFPLVWRVGAVAGLDAGKVWDSPSAIDLRRWAWNGVFGLRFYFDTFVARADLGVSREGTGFYLDFGHSF